MSQRSETDNYELNHGEAERPLRRSNTMSRETPTARHEHALFEGLLELRGTLNVTQFWPAGTSDADTTKVRVKVDTRGFKFSGKVTTALLNGFIGRDAVVRNGVVTIRLQGIDAPELHYRPTYLDSQERRYTNPERRAIAKVNAEFRQKLAETSTKALGHVLQGAGFASVLPCVVRTQVSKPNDVFDKHGRLVGDLYIQMGASSMNVNHWLLENGRAFPALYNSMANDEIEETLSLAKAAHHARLGVWKHPITDVRKFDFDLVYRNKPTGVPGGDEGPVSFPKVFRRVASWRVLQKARVGSGSFRQYLEAHPDYCYRTAEFEKHRQGQKADHEYLRQLSDFVKGDGRFIAEPGGLVFMEAESTLRDDTGKEITEW